MCIVISIQLFVCPLRRFRCCLNEGILLNLILDVFVPQIRCFELSSFRGKLNHEVEQAIFCLYGHPKKGVDRSKKKLQVSLDLRLILWFLFHLKQLFLQ